MTSRLLVEEPNLSWGDPGHRESPLKVDPAHFSGAVVSIRESGVRVGTVEALVRVGDVVESVMVVDALGEMLLRDEPLLKVRP